MRRATSLFVIAGLLFSIAGCRHRKKEPDTPKSEPIPVQPPEQQPAPIRGPSPG